MQSEQRKQTLSEPFGEREKGFMQLALDEATKAYNRFEVPVGCVIVHENVVVGRGSNRTNETRNATRHAEFEAIDEVLGSSSGDGGAPPFSEYIGCVYYGCGNDKFGGCGSVLKVNGEGCSTCGSIVNESDAQGDAPGFGHAFPAVGGLLAEQGIEILQSFYMRGNVNAPKPHRALQPH